MELIYKYSLLGVACVFLIYPNHQSYVSDKKS